MRSIFGALARPSMRSTTRLSFTSAIVGTVCTRKRSASSGSWSMSTAVTRSRSRSLRARCAIRLSMRRAGPERLAPKKTSRGRRSSPIGSHIPLQSLCKPRQRRALYTPGKDVGGLPDRSRARRRAWCGDAAGGGTRAAGIGRSRPPPSPRALRRAAQPRARLVVVPERKKLILVVIDGLTPDVFEDAVDTGAATALSFLAQHGSYRRGVSTFPSLTPVCLSSIATGAHPDVHRIPHLTWWHREQRRLVEYGSAFSAHPAAG